MKKSILRIAVLCALGIATSAAAEEMATPPSSFVTSQVPYLAWSGLYFGINGGYAWSTPSVSYAANDPASLTGICSAPGGAKCITNTNFNRDGGLFGGQIGFNWQFNSLWLGGVEADYQWSDLTGTGYSVARVGGVPGTSAVAATETVRSFGTIRVRLGALPFQSLLLYGTAGLAIGQVSENLTLTASSNGGLTSPSGYGYNCTAGNTCFTGSSSQTRVGWTAGAGAELALTTYLTLKAEALYVHFDAPSAVATAINGGGMRPSSFTGNFSDVYFIVARGGVNYRF